MSNKNKWIVATHASNEHGFRKAFLKETLNEKKSLDDKNIEIEKEFIARSGSIEEMSINNEETIDEQNIEIEKEFIARYGGIEEMAVKEESIDEQSIEIEKEFIARIGMAIKEEEALDEKNIEIEKEFIARYGGIEEMAVKEESLDEKSIEIEKETIAKYEMAIKEEEVLNEKNIEIEKEFIAKSGSIDEMSTKEADSTISIIDHVATSSNMNNLNEDNQTDNEKKILTCHLCGKEFIKSFLLLLHHKKKHNESDLIFSVDQENHPDQDESSLNLSQPVPAEEDLIQTDLIKSKLLYTLHKCCACHKRFTTTRELNMHIFKFHNGQKQEIICTCGFKTKSQTFFQNHWKIVHQEKTLKDILPENSIHNDCPFCPMTFSSRNFLKQHLSSAHSGMGLEEFMHLPKITSVSTLQHKDESIHIEVPENNGELYKQKQPTWL